MHHPFVPALLSLALGLAAQSTATAVTITFDNATVPGIAVLIPQYTESGFNFKPPGPIDVEPPYRLAHNLDQGMGWPKSGSPYLQLLRNRTMEFARLDGEAFRLVQLDLAEYSTVYPIPREISIVGYRPNGDLVTQILTLDGTLSDSIAGVSFQTFLLGPGFDNLLKVEVATGVVSIENVVVEPVPEPASAILALAGLALVLAGRFGRRPETSGEKSL